MLVKDLLGVLNFDEVETIVLVGHKFYEGYGRKFENLLRDDELMNKEVISFTPDEMAIYISIKEK